MMRFLSIPLNVVVLAAYNLMTFIGLRQDYPPTTVMTHLNLGAGSVPIPITWNTLFILGAVFVLFVEIFRATRTTDSSLANHLLSFVVFLGFLVELLMVNQLQNPTFLVLTSLALIDVLGGFTVSFKGAKRDIGLT